jgi:replication factor C subunit 3/5|uniref:Replication factor C C-terminal domain-containing protein n=1 Tax=viral metagenome TaxID=1070528 RepID=A0A6C0BL17_9ZZZZ
MAKFKLFVDQYIPETFEQISFNQTAAQQLIACSKAIEIPHMILKGVEGSGRKTFATLFIKSKYHLEQLHTKYQTVAIKNGCKTIELQMLYSDYHYQIDPSLHGVYDRIIIQGFVKDILQNCPINRTTPYHTVIINNADRLTVEAQQSLRRTLEKNISNCRFIFIVNQESTMIDSIVSRCIQIRLAAPMEDQITRILEHICQTEKIAYQVSQLQQIASIAKRNLLKAMNLLQYLRLVHVEFLNRNHPISWMGININDQYIIMLAQQLMTLQTPQEILRLRETMYDLLVQCIDPVVVLKGIFEVIFAQVKHDSQKHQLVDLLIKCENTLKQGSKPIYHLECFCLGVVEILHVSQ